MYSSIKYLKTFPAMHCCNMFSPILGFQKYSTDIILLKTRNEIADLAD